LAAKFNSEFTLKKIVALGGGHGLAATLSSLRSITDEITAVVTVADNGGSSGRIRTQFNFLPPGDLRMALAALCSDDEWGRNWAEILQYRFSGQGELSGHALGNLLLAALWDRDKDLVSGIERVGELLRIKGKVLPMALEPLDIEGVFITPAGEKVVRGQIEVATTRAMAKSLKLIPEDPKVAPQVLQAISKADWITIGPGSWFSSVMPHFLSEELSSAIENSPAKKVLIFNMPEPRSEGEFAGNTPREHLEFLLAHRPTLKIDLGVADLTSCTSELERASLEAALAICGGKLVIADLKSELSPISHGVMKMNSIFSHIFA
jgi:uncharacterized cofD-like protein